VEGRPPQDPLVAPPSENAGRGSIADGVKKALLAGVGALFLTEEGARRLARDWKLPKDVAAFLGQQAQSAKDEILRVFADEVRRFLESDPVRREFWRGLSENAIEIRAEIRFRPDKDGAPRPEVTATAARTGKRPRKTRK
jgi:hypothetical protein